MIQALKAAQIATSDQAKQIRALLKEKQLLSDQLRGSTIELATISSKSNSRRKKKSAVELLEDGVIILGFGKQFCVTEAPWLDGATFDLPNTFTGDPESPERAATQTTYDEGTRAILDRLIPEQYRAGMVDEPLFRTVVRPFKPYSSTVPRLIFGIVVYRRSELPANDDVGPDCEPCHRHIWFWHHCHI